jgi:hypothetical protein
VFSIHLVCSKGSLLLSAVLAALALPAAALAGNGDPIRDSLSDRGLTPAIGAGPAGVSSGTAASDWFERYVGAHPYGLRTIGATAESDPIRDSLSDRGLTPAIGARPAGVSSGTAASDWFERYAAAHPYGGVSALREAAGFNWSDAGVGAGFATGLLTLLAASLFAVRRHARQRMQVL